MSGLIKNAGIIGTIEELLASFDAGEKRAESYTEAGGYQGSSTHPVTKVDDRTEAASEGARSTENTDDVKNEPNRGQTVDETTPGPGAGQASVQTDIGMTSKETGTDASAETDSAKSGKQDPGSSHPARTDNDELDGQKFSSDYARLRAMWKRAEDLGSQLCAKIATDNYKQAEGDGTAGSTNSQAGGPGVKDGPRTEDGKINAKDDSGDNPAKQSAARTAGVDLANIFAGISDVGLQDKVAADAVVVDALTDVVGLAFHRAEKTAALYSAYLTELQKRAEGEMTPEEEAAAAEAAAGGGAPSEGGGGEGGGELPPEGGEGGGGDEEAALLELLSGGGAGGAEGGGEGSPELGGEDPAALMGAMGGGEGGGMPGGMPGGDMGGEGGGELGPEELAMLEQILQQEGIDPAELEAAMAGKQAAAKRASAKWTPKTAADRQKFAYMRSYIKELVGRSRS